MGRPKLEDEERLSGRLYVRVLPAEELEIKEIARDEGVSEWGRRVLLREARKRHPKRRKAAR